MLFFRSEERVRQWCADRDLPVQPIISLDQLWRLADAWYRERLEPGSRRLTPEEMAAIFRNTGLTGPFWDLEGASD